MAYDLLHYNMESTTLTIEKNCVLNHSITHSPNLFDVPGTEAFASEQISDSLWESHLRQSHVSLPSHQ